MKTTLISKENNIGKFSIEFTAEEFEQANIEAYKENKDRFTIDGFRKGKAPRSIIEKHYGEGVFFEDAINKLFAENYGKALEELQLEVIDSPKIEFSQVAKGEGLTMTFEVDLFPVVDVKDYFGVEVDEISPEIKDEIVDEEIEKLRKRNARIENSDQLAELGDLVILDYAGFVGEDQFPGGTAERQELKLGSGQFIPGFEEQLVGASIDEERDVKVTFPTEYHAPDLAGKEAVFKCKVHEIKREILPELDDEFAKDVSEFDTLDELKKDLKEKMIEMAKTQAKEFAKDEIIKKVVDKNQVTAPNSLVEEEVNRMLSQLDGQLRQQGLNLEQYIQYTGKKPEEVRGELAPEASQRVATRIILMSIADKENIKADDEDVRQLLVDYAKIYNTSVDELEKDITPETKEVMKKDIAITKTIDRLYDEAKVSYVTVEEKEAKMKAAEEENK